MLLSTLLIAASSAPTLGQSSARFVEFAGDGATITFDLTTVEILVPGKFTILGTTIDQPNQMKVRLKAHDLLKRYCEKPVGNYPPPDDVFVLGAPDATVENIRVAKVDKAKIATWKIPYKLVETSPRVGLNCDRPSYYVEGRNQILHGYQAKFVFDCNRAVAGMLVNKSDALGEAITFQLTGQENMAFWYAVVCLRVTKASPYLPKEKP